MKFKAFSLIEIIVALFLSAIIISAVYSGYLFTHQQFFRFAAVKTEIRNYFKLAEVLNREFETSKRVLKIGERRVDIELIDKTIKYTFENDFILRRVNEQVDSFFVNLQRIEMDGFYLHDDFVIDHLVLNMNGKKTVSFYKEYGAISQLEKEDGNKY